MRDRTRQVSRRDTALATSTIVPPTTVSNFAVAAVDFLTISSVWRAASRCRTSRDFARPRDDGRMADLALNALDQVGLGETVVVAIADKPQPLGATVVLPRRGEVTFRRKNIVIDAHIDVGELIAETF